MNKPFATLTGIAEQPGSWQSMVGNALFAVLVIGFVGLVVLVVYLNFKVRGKVIPAESGPPAEAVPADTLADQPRKNIVPKWFPIVYALLPLIVTAIGWLLFFLLRDVIHIHLP